MDNVTQSTPTTGDVAAATMADLTGQTLGDFHLLRKLGQGGMGRVYLAEQLSLKRKVALKVLRPELTANKTSLERFQFEARFVAQATHANIIQVYQVGEANGIHFIALEYVGERNLREFTDRKGPPDLPLALSIMRQVAAALQRAGELGIIHRDIKPDNILLTCKDDVKVADFGLSRVSEGEKPAVNLTQSGVTMGTPLYMSPEQVEGKPLDARTDIYSFGISCYQMMSGVPPFKGSTALAVALQHVRQEAAPLQSIRPDLPLELCNIIHKMMAKEPADRHQSGKELLTDLERISSVVAGQTSQIPLASTGHRAAGDRLAAGSAAPFQALSTTRMPSRRRRWLIVVLFLLSIGLAGTAGAFFGWVQQKDRSPSDDQADKLEPEVAPDIPALDDREKEREKRLRAEIDYHLDAARGFPNPKLGAETCLEYALPLLKKPERFREADDLFKRMELIRSPKVKPEGFYSVLGTLGRALVLSYQNDWRESDKLFQSLKDRLADPTRRRPGEGVERFAFTFQVVNSHPDLRKVVREAAQRNQVNSNNKVNPPPFLQAILSRDPFTPRDRPFPKKPDKLTDRPPAPMN